MTFTWIPFYKEFLQKLLKFRNNRAPLVDWIYGNIDVTLGSGVIVTLTEYPDPIVTYQELTRNK